MKNLFTLFICLFFSFNAQSQVIDTILFENFQLDPFPAMELIPNGDDTIWEQEPLMKLAEQGELMAFKHTGFWQPMDTLHDKNTLEKMWANGTAPWKKWA